MNTNLKKHIGKILMAGCLFAIGFHSFNTHALNKSLEHQTSTNEKFTVHVQGTKPDPQQGLMDFIKPPEDISTNGHHIMWLFNYITIAGFFFFLIIAGALIYFPWAYRARAGHRAHYTKGTDKNHLLVTGGLCAFFFVVLDYVVDHKSLEIVNSFAWTTPAEDQKQLKVMVYPQQWIWNFRYAGTDNMFNTADDIVTINELVIPKSTPIVFQIKSKDVIHGFFVPNVRQQIDAIPGKITHLWFDANKNGEYEILCAHLCGTAHYKMKAFMKVVDEEDFNAWSKEKSEWAAAMYDPDDKLTHWGWPWGIKK